MEEEEQICPVCRRGSRYGEKHKYCYESWSLEGLTCFWKYEGLVKKLIAEAKYNFYYDQLNELSERSWKLIERVEFGKLRKFLELGLVVVPVPLAKKRLRERGFNQAEIISKSLATRYKLAQDSHRLMKMKETEQQVGKSREERLENLEGAFSTTLSNPPPNLGGGRKGVVFPRAVLLVDDVWTTGATLSECAKVLRQAGVRRVWGVVLAR